MANKPRNTRSSGSSSAKPSRTGSSAPRTGSGRPSRPSDAFIPSNRPIEPTAESKPQGLASESAAPSPMANYLVPGGLLLALVLSLFWLQARNKAAAEKPSVSQDPSADQNGTSAQGSAVAPNSNNNNNNNNTDGLRPIAPPSQPNRPRARNVVPAGNFDAVVPSFPAPTSPDPRGGKFTLADATASLPPGNTLVAEIQTSMGSITCKLFTDKAPNTVANFAGLANGTREFWDPVKGGWVKRPFYDGSIFHRVIPQFMIQGGDILRSGTGGPGYRFDDENVNGHDRGGLLCMANSGPNTNGSQFFITEVGRPHLDGTYSIFGECGPLTLVEDIAREPRSANDRPNQPVVIQHVEIHR